MTTDHQPYTDRRRTALLAAGILAICFAAVLALCAEAAGATNTDQVCTGLDSGKIDVSGDHATLTLTAPDGQLIDRYCVKAGSTQQGNGPEYVDVDPPAATVTIAHSSGKDISHYSLSYIPVEQPPTTTTPTTTAPPPPPPTTVPPTTPPPDTDHPEPPTVIGPPVNDLTPPPPPAPPVDELPNTGSSGWLLAAALVLLAAGAAALAGSRTRGARA